MPVAEWLVFILGSLRKKGDIPKLYNGRPIDRFRGIKAGMALREFLLTKIHLSHGVALDLTAQKIQNAKKIYDSDAFDVWRHEIRAARKIEAAKKRTRKTPR